MARAAQKRILATVKEAPLRNRDEPSTIVLVDDDRAVRSAVTFSLETDGYRVMSFPDARSLLLNLLPAADCYVIDHMLPGGMHGLDLIVELRSGGVVAPAILITTYPSTDLRRRAALLNTPIVEKPLLGSGLMMAVGRALAG